jgi:starch synthase (maltosyl-transferring)
MAGRFGIDDVHPVVEHGRYPAKAVVGEHVPIHAAVWRDGHEALGVELVVRPPGQRGLHRQAMVVAEAGLDRWAATLVPDRLGAWVFRIDAWSDPWHTWRDGILKKLAAGLSDVDNELEIGARLLERAAARGGRERLLAAVRTLRDKELTAPARAERALAPEIDALLTRAPIRELVDHGDWHTILVERPRALTGAWYELFPRSTGGVDAAGQPVHGTFATAAEDLPRIAAMGFDVVYLPPIHPIGEISRKGRNNTVPAEPGEVGSPWAIGSAAGGHDAIHPELGSTVDFAGFVERARALGLEIALDLALQCAPDHPWLAEHPQWFKPLPDGSLAYAENPPKRYQDIHPLHFDVDPVGLETEVERILQHWIGLGVRTFRVDNPHTKPPDFWARLIGQIQRQHPDVVFLAEAFTRPAIMHGLAMRGFSQSYTYFTWRETKAELTAYLTELVAAVDHMRPNLWVNTPDILPAQLAGAGLPAFAIRAALAATLGPSWGMYSGFELGENTPLAPGTEEYLDSEKYQLRPRDFTALPSLQGWIARLNRLRRQHPALGQLRTLRFHEIDSPHLMAYSKTDPASGDAVLCLVTLDPSSPRRGRLTLDPTALGQPADAALLLHDEITGERRRWRGPSEVDIDPAVAVARVLEVQAP